MRHRGAGGRLRRGLRRGTGRAIAMTALVVLAVCLSDPPSPATGDDPAAGAWGAEVLVAGAPLGPEIPTDFLGLSVETSALDQDEVAPGRPVLAQLLSNLGSGLIRFGGNTLDQSAWEPAGTFPGATSAVTPTDLADMFAFVKHIGWTVLLGVDLGHYDPAAAADEAATAARLGGTALTAFEFGNEPDLYVRSYAGALRPSSYTMQDYIREWQHYLRAVRRRVPDPKVVGPDIAGIPGSLDMLRRFVEAEHDAIAFATSHHYPVGVPIPSHPRTPASLTCSRPAFVDGTPRRSGPGHAPWRRVARRSA